MSSRPDPSALRWLIGAELANLRRDAGLSLTDLSKRTGIGRAKHGHMETGKYTQYPDDIAKALKACGANERDIDRLSSLAGRTSEKSWWAPYAHVLPDWMRTYVGLEGLAAAAFVYEPVVIPGLLQTEEYAATLTEAVGFVRSDHAERFVSFRRARAGRLTADNPLRLHAVMEEGALLRLVGDSDIMKRQYQHLCTMAESDNITVQIVRPQDGPHAAAPGQFIVLDFSEATSTAFSEQYDGAVYVQDPDAVRTYRMVADNLERVAQTPEKSLALVRKLAKQT